MQRKQWIAILALPMLTLTMLAIYQSAARRWGRRWAWYAEFWGLLAGAVFVLPVAAPRVEKGPGGGKAAETERAGIALAALASVADLAGSLLLAG